MNILITGCNGQLGNEMQLLARENVQHSYFFTDVEELDITDSEAVEAFVEFNAIDCIVNCAAYTAVDKAEENEELCDLLNNVAPGHLAKAVGCRQAWWHYGAGLYRLRVRRNKPHSIYGKRTNMP